MFEVSGFPRLDNFPEDSPQIFNWIQIRAFACSLQNAYIVVNKTLLTDLTVCFGMSSCWKVIFVPKLRASADCFKFSFIILMSWSCFMMSFIFTGFPVPLAEKHPQNIKLRQPWFTVGTVFLGLKVSHLVRQMKVTSLSPKISNLVLSNRRIGGQKFMFLS